MIETKYGVLPDLSAFSKPDVGKIQRSVMQFLFKSLGTPVGGELEAFVDMSLSKGAQEIKCGELAEMIILSFSNPEEVDFIVGIVGEGLFEKTLAYVNDNMNKDMDSAGGEKGKQSGNKEKYGKKQDRDRSSGRGGKSNLADRLGGRAGNKRGNAEVDREEGGSSGTGGDLRSFLKKKRVGGGNDREEGPVRGGSHTQFNNHKNNQPQNGQFNNGGNMRMRGGGRHRGGRPGMDFGGDQQQQQAPQGYGYPPNATAPFPQRPMRPHFAHPPAPAQVQCAQFPYCQYGTGCRFFHPQIECKFGVKCLNKFCNYVHKQSDTLCRFYPSCTKGDACPFFHPSAVKDCKFGVYCTKRATCPFKHPDAAEGKDAAGEGDVKAGTHISERQFSVDENETPVENLTTVNPVEGSSSTGAVEPPADDPSKEVVSVE
eukprot:Nk52_evm60s554 gene=Nk52_evmTU60s554